MITVVLPTVLSSQLGLIHYVHGLSTLGYFTNDVTDDLLMYLWKLEGTIAVNNC